MAKTKLAHLAVVFFASIFFNSAYAAINDGERVCRILRTGR